MVSISKWEAKYHRSYIDKGPNTEEELIDYVQFMTLTQNVDRDIYYHLSKENIEQIKEYLENPMSATTFTKDKSKGSSKKEIVTSEIIYYWMISLNIPMECQKWHLNRLLTLIRVCSIKNSPPKKMSKKSVLQRNAALNAKRKKALNTTG